MADGAVWNVVLPKPEGPTSKRLGLPWLVHAGAPCPCCGLVVTQMGESAHECGEKLTVLDTSPALTLLVRYPAGYVVVRSDRWDRYLIKVPTVEPLAESDSRVPLTTLHSMPWVIWDGSGVTPPAWGRADQCPECGKAYARNNQGVAFRCGCRARLMPLPLEMLQTLRDTDVVGKLWDEQALVLKYGGVHLLLSTLTFQSG